MARLAPQGALGLHRIAATGLARLVFGGIPDRCRLALGRAGAAPVALADAVGAAILFRPRRHLARRRSGRGIDIIGAVLLTAECSCLVYTLLEADRTRAGRRSDAPLIAPWRESLGGLRRSEQTTPLSR